jgi:hypothetical protein
MRRLLLPAALAATLVGGAAQAQTDTGSGQVTPGQTGPPPNQLIFGPGGQIIDPVIAGAAGQQVNPGQVGPLVFVPGVGFVPQGNLGGAFPLVDQSGLGAFSSNGFNPFFGTPFFGGGFGPWWGGPVALSTFNGLRPINQVNLLTAPTYAMRVPTLGITTPPAAVGRQRARVEFLPATARSPAVSTAAQRVAGAREETMTPEEAQTVSRARSLMLRDRPLYEGRVVSRGVADVRVRYNANGQPRTEQFDTDNVFFFGTDDELMTMTSNPDAVRVGDTVLVPGPSDRPGAATGQEALR